jgi:prepilin-type N-terminal cleavage/methylation domain-containing protein
MPQSPTWPVRPQRAFTLVEVAVVVVILGLLAALVLPGYRRVSLKSRATAAVNDLRVFSAAFNNVSLQNGTWPAGGTGPGIIPPEMANALPDVFTKQTPIGGNYEWISNSDYKAAIGITVDGTTDMELLTMLDSIVDDGDLGNGSVILSGPDLIYIIER